MKRLLPMSQKVGRVSPSAPQPSQVLTDGARGATRPTTGSCSSSAPRSVTEIRLLRLAPDRSPPVNSAKLR